MVCALYQTLAADSVEAKYARKGVMYGCWRQAHDVYAAYKHHEVRKRKQQTDISKFGHSVVAEI